MSLSTIILSVLIVFTILLIVLIGVLIEGVIFKYLTKRKSDLEKKGLYSDNEQNKDQWIGLQHGSNPEPCFPLSTQGGVVVIRLKKDRGVYYTPSGAILSCRVVNIEGGYAFVRRCKHPKSEPFQRPAVVA